MYKCQDCGAVFDEPREEHTTYEWYYGVADLFRGSHPMIINHCPDCDSENIGEYTEDDEEEE